MGINLTPLKGVYVLDTSVFQDERGIFTRIFCKNEMAEILGSRHILQINNSSTHLVGSIRGLHYQSPPYAEMKFVRCVKGRVWDVAVDLRASSPSFLSWYAQELSAENARMLVIPEGCAHGFQVLEEDSELLYLTTQFYQPDAEAGVAYNDPTISIEWPMNATVLSEKDKNHPLLNKQFSGIIL